MRLFLNIVACVLIGAMLLQPMFAAKGLVGLTSSDMAMAALGLAGLMLGYRGSGRRRGKAAEEAERAIF